VTRHVSLLYMGRTDPITEGRKKDSRRWEGNKKKCNLLPWALNLRGTASLT